MVLEDRLDTEDRSFAVIDATGVLYASVEAAVRERDEQLSPADGDGPSGPRFFPSLVDAGDRSPDELRLELSERVRSEELCAFVEIPASVLDEDGSETIRYYSDQPTYKELRRWLREVLNDEIRRRRFVKHELDRRLVERISRRVGVDNLGLASRAEDDDEARELCGRHDCASNAICTGTCDCPDGLTSTTTTTTTTSTTTTAMVSMCAHDECVSGVALEGGCSSCVEMICACDFFCCLSEWDEICVKEAQVLCERADCESDSGCEPACNCP